MKPLISMRKVVPVGNVVVLDEKKPNIRNNRGGNSYQAGEHSDWLECHKQSYKTRDEEGEGVEGEGEGEGEGVAGSADWRVRASPRNKPTARGKNTKQLTCRSVIGAHSA